MLSQHRMWTACLCLQRRMIPHLCLLAMPSLLRVTISLLNRSTSRIWQIHQFIYRECCSNSKPMMSPSSINLIPLDITINYVYITPDRKTEFQTLIEDDLLLHCLTEMIIAGWPDDINDVPHALYQCHGHRSTLTVEDNLILRGETLIIPPSEREKILQAIHEGRIFLQNPI